MHVSAMERGLAVVPVAMLGSIATTQCRGELRDLMKEIEANSIPNSSLSDCVKKTSNTLCMESAQNRIAYNLSRQLENAFVVFLRMTLSGEATRWSVKTLTSCAYGVAFSARLVQRITLVRRRCKKAERPFGTLRLRNL
jgi:hypothetical protein